MKAEDINLYAIKIIYPSGRIDRILGYLTRMTPEEYFRKNTHSDEEGALTLTMTDGRIMTLITLDQYCEETGCTREEAYSEAIPDMNDPELLEFIMENNPFRHE